METKNEILEEIWRIKDDMGKEYSYDIEKMGKALKEKQRSRKAQVVNLRQQKSDAA